MDDEKTISLTERLKNSLALRLLIIGFLILIMLIPFAMIQTLVDEREHRRDSVIQEINSKWAFNQTIAGPVLEIPYKVYWERQYIENNQTKKVLNVDVKTAYFLPDKLDISGTILPEKRYRGIYESVVYTADLEIKGEFQFPDFEKWKIPREHVVWDEALFSVGISDMRGINRDIEAQWDDADITLKPGLRNKNVFPNGVSIEVDIDETKTKRYSFTMRLNIRGSLDISFLPVGRKTNVHLSSGWSSPSFNGLFLPKESVINEEGFQAQWELFDYNREFPQQWKEDKWDLYDSKFGLELFVPVDEYQQTTRSVKYAILFISLTFLAFFLIIEMLNKRRVHPIQYLLVGFALSMFYLLLISLSEHLSFYMAYLISGICITGLTTFYTKSVSKKCSLTIIMGAIFTGLYGFLYIILRLEDYSLLVGTLGLFIILAAVMVFTRKIDWYAFRIDPGNRDKTL